MATQIKPERRGRNAHHYSSLDNLHTDHIEGKPPPYANKKAYQRVLSSHREHYLVHRASAPQLLSRRLSNSTGNLIEENSSDDSSHQSNGQLDRNDGKSSSHDKAYASSEPHRRHNSMYETPVSLRDNGPSSLPQRPLSCEFGSTPIHGRRNSWELKFNAGLERLKAQHDSSSRPSSSTSSAAAARRQSSYEQSSDNDSDGERSSYHERHRPSTPRQYSSMELLINDGEEWQKKREQEREKARRSRDSLNTSDAENQKTQNISQNAVVTLRGNNHKHHQQAHDNHRIKRQEITDSGEEVLHREKRHNEKVTGDTHRYLARVVTVVDTDDLGGTAQEQGERNKNEFHTIDVQRTEVAKEMPLFITKESSEEQEESNGITEGRRRSSSSESSTASASTFSSYIPAQQHRQDTGGRPDEDAGLHTATPIFLHDSPPASPDYLHDSTDADLKDVLHYLKKQNAPGRSGAGIIGQRKEVQQRENGQRRSDVQVRAEEVVETQQRREQVRKEIQKEEEQQQWEEVRKQKVWEGEEDTTVSTLRREIQQLKQMKEEIQQHLIHSQATLKDQVRQLTSSLEEEQQRRQEERVSREQMITSQQKDLEELRRQVKHLQTQEAMLKDKLHQLTSSMEKEQRRRQEERTSREQIIQDQQRDVDKLRGQVKHLQTSGSSVQAEATLRETVRQLTSSLKGEQRTRQEEQARSEQIIQDQQKDLSELRGQVKYLQTSEIDQVRQLTRSLEEEQRRRQEERAGMEQIIQDQRKHLDQLRSQVKHLETSALTAQAETRLQWQVNDLRERLQEEQRRRADELLLYEKEIMSLKSTLEARDRDLNEARREVMTRGVRKSTPADEEPPWEMTRPRVPSVGSRDPPPEREPLPTTADGPSRKVTMRNSFSRSSRLSKSAADLTTPAPASSQGKTTTNSYDQKRPQFPRPSSLSIDHSFFHDPHKLSASPASADPRRAPIIGDAFTPFPRAKVVPRETNATPAANSKRRSPITEDSVDNYNPQREALVPLEAQRPHAVDRRRQDSLRSSLGLPNLGNTSYINAVMQCLFTLDPLRLYFMRQYHKSERGGGSLVEAVAGVFAAMESGTGVLPAMQNIKDVVESRDKVFRLHPHPPAHHLLSSLLSWLHSDLATDPGDAPLGLTTSVISSLFHGLQESVILCPVKRDVVSSVPECFDHFTLTLPPGPAHATLQDLLTQRLRPYEMVWGCGLCNDRHTCTHITRLYHLPDVLVFVLARPKDNSESRGQVRVDFPAIKLTLHNHLVQPAKSSSMYELVGICNHQGTTSSGHYTAYCRSGSGKWWLWDDMNLEAVHLHQVLSPSEVHILFYQATQQDS